MSCAVAELDLLEGIPLPQEAPPAPAPAPGFIPDLRFYDWIVISTSAGKDSQASTDVAVEMAAVAGVLDRVVMVHADLGDAEWPGTPELARDHAAAYGVRFELVHRVNKDGHREDLLQQIEARGFFPSASARFCTSGMKRGPVRKLFTRLAAESRAAGLRHRPVRSLSVMGLRAAESPHRAELEAFWHDAGETCLCAQCQAIPRAERPAGQSNGRKHIDHWLPIHHWSREQTLWRCVQAPTLMHPAYSLGFPRASCVFCVLASRSALIRACQVMPELAARYAALEDRIGHTIQHRFSIKEAIRLAAEAPGPVLVRNWKG